MTIVMFMSSFLAGAIATLRFLPFRNGSDRRSWQDWLMFLPLAIGVGAGLSSIVYFWVGLVGGFRNPFLLMSIDVILALAVFAVSINAFGKETRSLTETAT
ncbi:hypothetical protein BVX99_03010, partial [bacterium F16]